MLEPVAEEDRAGGRDSTMNGLEGALRAERITNAPRATGTALYLLVGIS
jgi:hypothetical protein